MGLDFKSTVLLVPHLETKDKQ